MTTLVSDAVATMKRAEEVIGGLMAVNDRLRRENLAMLEALQALNSAINLDALANHFPSAEAAVRQIDAAIKFAKGESHV